MKDNDNSEYSHLKNEVMFWIDAQNNIYTVLYTLVGGVVALGMQQNNPFIFLICFLVIIPLQSRVITYRKNTMKIAGYMIVYLENSWETRNYLFRTKMPQKGKDNISKLRNYLFTILGVSAYALFLAYSDVFTKDFITNILHSQSHGALLYLAPFFLVICVFILDKSVVHTSKLLNDSVNLWSTYRKKDDNQKFNVVLKLKSQKDYLNKKYRKLPSYSFLKM